MASQRASITKELLRESLESVLKPFKIDSLDDGKFSCVLEFLMGREVFVYRKPPNISPEYKPPMYNPTNLLTLSPFRI